MFGAIANEWRGGSKNKLNFWAQFKDLVAGAEIRRKPICHKHEPSLSFEGEPDHRKQITWQITSTQEMTVGN